jgi:peptidoglycan hydrolase FlgJ
VQIETALQPPRATHDDRDMRQAAEELEAAFLAEMLKPMGAAKTRDSFGGGVGEEQFSTFLVQEEARAMARSGGIGLAESIFQAMKQSSEAADAGQ